MRSKSTAALLIVIAVLAMIAIYGIVGAAYGLGGFPDYFIAVSGDEQLRYVPEGLPYTNTPQQAPTAIPTWTPSRTPTSTSSPTATSTQPPTATPLPNTPTPTQEFLTWTPEPTSTPMKQCRVKGQSFTINVRLGPGTNYPITDHVGRGKIVELYEVMDKRDDDGYLWARTVGTQYHHDGWFVIMRRYNGVDTWWVYGTESTSTCVDINGWPTGLIPPSPVVVLPTQVPTSAPPAVRSPILGVHVVSNTNANELVAFYQVLEQKGISSGVKSVNDTGLCRAAQANGQLCIYRTVHPADCPNVLAPDPRIEARRWANAISPYILGQNIRPDYIEAVNECDMGNLAWWNEFMLEFIAYTRSLGWPPLVLPTLNPGVGDSSMIYGLKPALVALRDSGGCFGMHAYNNINVPGETRLVDGDIWVAYRHRMVHASMVGAGIGDLPICITEAARGNGGLPPDEADFAAYYESIKNDTYVLGVFLWTGGAPHPWEAANLNGHMLGIANRVY